MKTTKKLATVALHCYCGNRPAHVYEYDAMNGGPCTIKPTPRPEPTPNEKVKWGIEHQRLTLGWARERYASAWQHFRSLADQETSPERVMAGRSDVRRVASNADSLRERVEEVEKELAKLSMMLNTLVEVNFMSEGTAKAILAEEVDKPYLTRAEVEAAKEAK